MPLKSSRTARKLSIGLGSALALSLVLGSALTAQADTPTPNSHIQQLVQKYGKGNLVREKTKKISPNVNGLVSKKQASRFRALSASALPASYSLQQYAVPVGDQKTVNSCVAWAIGYSMLGWYSMYQGQYKQYAPMYVYSQDAYPGDGGSTVPDAYKILGEQGTVTQAQYTQGNYNYKTKPTAAQKAAAAANKITAPHWLYDVGDSEAGPGEAARTAIETAITQKHPVALSINIYEPFYDLGYGTPTSSLMRASQVPGTENYGGHEVLIVGYNSTGVIIQNQWGTDWGNKGFATLDWAFVEKYSYDASWIYGFQKQITPQAPATVDEAAVHVSASSYNNTAFAYVQWRGTADFDDAVVHPVTGYTVTLNGSDGSAQTYTQAPDEDNYTQTQTFDYLPQNVTYTMTIAANNAVGTGPVTTYTFTPNTTATYTLPLATDLASPAMPAAKPLPAIAPSDPWNVKLTGWMMGGNRKISKEVMTWSKPTSLGRAALAAYRIVVVGKSGTKVKYSHTFNLSKTTKSKSFPFTGKYHLVRGLKYTFTLQAKNTAGYWSAGSLWRTQKL